VCEWERKRLIVLKNKCKDNNKRQIIIAVIWKKNNKVEVREFVREKTGK
jgi:hypothetical protein